MPRVEILANQQPTVAYESLKSGRANWVHALPPAQYQEAKANPDLVVQEWTAANASYRTLEFNLTRPFLADKRVRQALAYAVSRTDLLDVAEQGLATPQFSFVQPTNQRWVNNAVGSTTWTWPGRASCCRMLATRCKNNQSGRARTGSRSSYRCCIPRPARRAARSPRICSSSTSSSASTSKSRVWTSTPTRIRSRSGTTSTSRSPHTAAARSIRTWGRGRSW